MESAASREASRLQRDTDSPQPAAAPSAAANRVLFLLGLSVVINYIDRSNLSIAAPLIKDELGISGAQLGTLLSAFFWTYACLQIPAGWLVDRFDVKWVFAAGFFLWSLATAVTGVLHGFLALLSIRVVLGIGESIAFPSYSRIFSSHYQEHRRGFANSVVMASLALGPALGMLIGGTAVGRFGWRPFFITLGLAGLLWLVPWWAWMPGCGSEAKQRPEHDAGLRHVLRQRSVWGTCICQFCFNYASYFLVTWLPFYLVRSRGLSMGQMARVGGLVFCMSAISSMVCGKFSDAWVGAGSTPTNVRKGLAVTGQLGQGIFLVLAAFSPAPAYIWMLTLMGVFQGMAGCNNFAISQIIAGPHLAGRWAGVQNFVGNLAGVVSPALTGLLLDRTGRFYWPFVIAAAVAWCGAFSWRFVVGPVEEMNWEKVMAKTPSLSPS
jgi:MFS transporter, ACS family, D-galactonate transporter